MLLPLPHTCNHIHIFSTFILYPFLSFCASLLSFFTYFFYTLHSSFQMSTYFYILFLFYIRFFVSFTLSFFQVLFFFLLLFSFSSYVFLMSLCFSLSLSFTFPKFCPLTHQRRQNFFVSKFCKIWICSKQ